MEQKYFMHRIQEDNGAYTKGIEVHDTLDSAILSFWGRMKLGYGASSISFVSCKITDASGGVIEPYDLTWNATSEHENKFFLHHIRKDGDSFSKDIDVYDTFDPACASYAAQMEYGYNNARHSGVSFVSCEITNRSGVVLHPFNETWVKAEEEVLPEEEPEQE